MYTVVYKQKFWDFKTISLHNCQIFLLSVYFKRFGYIRNSQQQMEVTQSFLAIETNRKTTFSYFSDSGCVATQDRITSDTAWMKCMRCPRNFFFFFPQLDVEYLSICSVSSDLAALWGTAWAAEILWAPIFPSSWNWKIGRNFYFLCSPPLLPQEISVQLLSELPSALTDSWCL